MNNYIRDNVRELLICTVMSNNSVEWEYFNNHLDDPSLLIMLIEIAKDDYSGDARMQAAYWISKFDIQILSKVETDLLILQNDELDSISCVMF